MLQSNKQFQIIKPHSEVIDARNSYNIHNGTALIFLVSIIIFFYNKMILCSQVCLWEHFK